MADAGPWDAKSTGEIAFTITTTLADHLAYQRYYRTLPFFRHALQNLVIIAVAAAPVVGVVVCLLVAWGLTGTPCALDEDLGTAGKAWLFGTVTGGLLLADGLYLAFFLLTWRRRAENRARANLEVLPHVVADGDELKERLQIRMNDHDYACETPNYSFAYSWAVSQCFAETAEHMFIMADTRRGLFLPKRDMHAATIVAVRDLASRKLPATPVPQKPHPGLRA